MWGGVEGCEHEWGEDIIAKANDSNRATMEWTTGGDVAAKVHGTKPSQGAFCRHCHAWRGSLGLEPTPEIYIEHMVEVFREVKRVLRKDGTCWVNMGDSYAQATSRNRNGGESSGLNSNPTADVPMKNIKMVYRHGLKPKDLCGMPWRLAFALQADGWWLRSEIIWAKPNPMPESVTDRPTKAHETVFLLTKASRYFYDQEAVREPNSPETQKYFERYEPEAKTLTERTRQLQASSGNIGRTRVGAKNRAQVMALLNPAGRNRRTVWTIPTAAFPGAHFATFPPALIEPMILTSPTKCCAVCGTGWERVTKKEYTDQSISESEKYNQGLNALGTNVTFGRGHVAVTTLGFAPACDCGSEETKPATVLDPFCGAGTTIMVALRHGRNAIGLELSEEYAEMARKRITDDSPMFNGR